MFLRKNRRIKDGKDHAYWSLMETVRTDSGPRQRMLCYLGEINSSQEKTWRKAIKVFNNDGLEEQLLIFPSDSAPTTDNDGDNESIVRIDLKSVRLERAREFGAVYVALEMWKKLGLDKFWASKIDYDAGKTNGRPPEIQWSKVAALLSINRLCDPYGYFLLQHSTDYPKQ